MGSFHGLIGYGFAVGMGLINDFSWKLIVIYPLVVCGVSVVNGLVWGTFTLIMKNNEYLENLDMNNFQDPNDESVEDDEPKESYFKRL